MAPVTTPDSFILGVDLDGVCGDHTAAFRDIVASELGCAPDDLGEHTTWSFAEWGLTDEEYIRIHRKAVTHHRMFRTMPAIEGVAETLWRLSDAGVWIRLITHRLYVNWGHQVAVSDTVAWLDEQKIPYRDLCFLGQKPQVEADAYIDDAPHNVEALRRAGNPVVVFDQPYNRDLAGPRARDWEEAEQLVIDLVIARGIPVQGKLLEVDEPTERLERKQASGGS